MKYKYVIFDLDDTLLDFKAIENIAIKEVFEHYNIEHSTENIKSYKDINSKLWTDLELGLVSKQYILEERFALFFDTLNLTHDSIEAETLFRKYLNQGSQKIEYADELLKAISNNDITVLAGSNGLSETQYIRLKDANLLDYFDKLFISESVGYEKPNPLFFEAIFNDYPDITKDNVIMIGDTLGSDIKGACNVGIDCIWYNPKSIIQEDLEITHTISHLKEILEILGINDEKTK